jgi:hypothetical protein
MREFTLLSFAAHLDMMASRINDLDRGIVEKACELVCNEAKRVIGVGYPDWPPLKPETLARKFYNTPLLETGAMRDSIGWTVSSDGREGCVGSDDVKALWHELGTSRIPPRSFLREAAQRMEPKIHKLAARAVVAYLVTGDLMSPELRELLHVLHTVKEAVHAAEEGWRRGQESVDSVTPESRQ